MAGPSSGSRSASARSKPKQPVSIMSPCGTARCDRRGDRSHARHARRDLGGEKAETCKPDAPLDLFTQIVETKAPVADAGRRRAVIEHGNRHRIEHGAHVKAL